MGERFYSPVSQLEQLDEDSHSDHPPPLALPALHLGSFDFDTASFHAALSSSPRPLTRDQQHTPTASSPALRPPGSMAVAPLPPPSPADSSWSRRPVSALDTNTLPSSREQPKARPLGHSLTIHVPGPLTPSPSDRDGPSIASPPVFRHSPSVARRRTVIQTSNVNYEGNVVDLAGTPPRQGTLEHVEHGPVAKDAQVRPASVASVERGSIIMPQPQIVDAQPQPASPRRLEKKPATHDLKQSPSSQSVKRSLPRPPKMDTPPIQQPVFADKAAHQPAPVPAPAPASSWPPLKIERPTASPIPVEPAQMLPAYYAKQHQSNGSVSSIPVVAGLADAGPYFAAAPNTPVRQPTARDPAAPATAQALGLGRPGALAGAGAPGPSRVKQEEVCLECMMRDRDLADVDVQGEGVWARASDGDMADLVWREEALLKSMGDLDTTELQPVVDEASSQESRGESEEDIEGRRKRQQERARQAAVKAKMQEADWRISREVGWRGFKWEEGKEGEGLPRNFRGGKGGDLTTEGIKMVMTKFPSASAFRYQKLQDYLRNQWTLVLETRAEAQRVGGYAFPDDLGPASSTSSHEVRAPSTALPSAVAYANGRGASASSPKPAPGMRPSPSSPAGLSLSSTAAQTPLRQAPLQRPLTHYLPEREPVRQPVTPTNRVDSFAHNNSILTPQSRHFRNSPSQERDTEELWSPDDEPTQNLRPFSFAVRAGAVARNWSDGGHGPGRRKSLFGRWGGSVTSFFGGSQNGSGSMMDMHVGLDSDNRNKSVSAAYPRAVSLASPTRPSFFSNSSSIQSHDPPPTQRISRAISHSLLSQVQLGSDPEQEEGGATKKKGIKGFLKKMTGGKKKEARSRANSTSQPSAPKPVAQPETPLAPPPPISVLVGGRDPAHARQGSGSSSSMLTDGQESVNNRLSGSILYGNRSVSAPLNNASSSEVSVGQSGSPASSRFMTTGQTKRESYSSAGGRRRSTVGEMGEERKSGMEVFSCTRENGRGGYDDVPASLRPGRPNNITNTSLSASSGTMLETPPALNYGSGSFFTQQQTPGKLTINTDMPNHTPSNSIGSLSPNRYKNLPPIPPGDLVPIYPNQSVGSRGMIGSPDSFIAAFPDQEFAEYGGRVPTRQATGPGSPYYNGSYPQPQPSQQMSQQRLQPTSAYAPGYGYGGRASLDQRASSPRVERGGQRAVQTMYGMPSGMGNGYGLPSGPGLVEGEKKKKGLKGFFGGSKAGRLA
ncbi:hypothetical protein IAR50_001536 [Cryptococcus sp. DSM 104548]